MLSKLCRSSYSGFKVVNKSLWVKTSHVTCLNNSCIWLPKHYIHSLNDNIKVSETLSKSEEYFPIPDLPSLDENVLNALTEPSFASIGLNNFTPPGLIQSILENVHIYLNLPWWACIGITAILLRFCMLPLMISQRRVFSSYQESMTKMTKIIIEACEAKASGNSILMMLKVKEFQNFIDSNQLTVKPLLIPPMVQAPLFISVFLALRGMADVPVASLKTGGLYWFTDLTVFDPYYVLPLITSVTLAIVLLTGAEIPGPQGKNMKLALNVIPVVTFFFVCHFPSTLLLYWTCSNMFSLSFHFLSKIEAVQKVLNIPSNPIPPAIDNPKNYGLTDIMKLIQSMQEIEVRKRADEMLWSKKEQDDILVRGLSASSERMRLKNQRKVLESSANNNSDIENDEKNKDDNDKEIKITK